MSQGFSELPPHSRNSYSTYIDTGDDVLPVQTTATTTTTTSRLQQQQLLATQPYPASSANPLLSSATKPLLNKAVYIEPSPSGVTRIHISQVDTGSNVTDKVKQVNELFQRNSSGSSVRARSMSPLSQYMPPPTQALSRNCSNNSSRVNPAGATLLRTGQFNVAGQIQRPYECEKLVAASTALVNSSSKRDNCTSPIQVVQSSDKTEKALSSAQPNKLPGDYKLNYPTNFDYL
jgi:hypothetical protein